VVSARRASQMVRRRVADLWRTAAVGVDAQLTDWARLYQELLGELASLVGNPELSSDAVRERLCTLLQTHRARRPRSRAEIVRERLIEGVPGGGACAHRCRRAGGRQAQEPQLSLRARFEGADEPSGAWTCGGHLA
jgi:hypothetical protein